MYLLFRKPARCLRHTLLAALLSLYTAAAYAGGNHTGEAALTDSVPAHWTYDEHFNQSIPTDDNWWHQLGDPLLDSLIARGIENNPNVVIAGKRIAMAKEALKAARAGYYPSLGLQGGWTKARSSGALGDVSMPATTADYFSLGLNMSWEIDVFGKISAKAAQQKALYNATRAEYAATMVTLCANIAKAYVNLRVWQAEWQVAVEHIASQEKIVKITEARHEAGLASMLDVTQARIVYYSTQASMPTLRTSIRTTINSIALLLGVYPRDINDLLEPPRPLPDHRQIVPVGVPAELLRRRPDIVESEYELASYAAALGIAKRDFLPTLSLNGAIGTSAHNAGDLFSRNSLTYSIAPTLTWTLFDGMSRRANMASARQQMEIGIESYNNTVMTAVEEADNAITTYAGTLRNLDILEEVVAQSRKSLDLSLDLYKRGLSPFNNVVTAQMNLLEYQNSVVTAGGNALTALITLYEALGGGWDVAGMQ